MEKSSTSHATSLAAASETLPSNTNEAAKANANQSLTNAERDVVFMRIALHQAELALKAEEIPVGCAIMLGDAVIATGYNKTNETRNGTK